EISF
ncbi:hypothetical protein CP061683_0541B, partial [Chlamydia psittaci 06-1683]